MGSYTPANAEKARTALSLNILTFVAVNDYLLSLCTLTPFIWNKKKPKHRVHILSVVEC